MVTSQGQLYKCTKFLLSMLHMKAFKGKQTSQVLCTLLVIIWPAKLCQFSIIHFLKCSFPTNFNSPENIMSTLEDKDFMYTNKLYLSHKSTVSIPQSMLLHMTHNGNSQKILWKCL